MQAFRMGNTESPIRGKQTRFLRNIMHTDALLIRISRMFTRAMGYSIIRNTYNDGN